MRVWVLAFAVVASGCLGASPASVPAGAEQPVPVPADRHVTTFTGNVPHSAVEGMGHSRPAEDLFWPVSQPGFLLNLSARPEAMEVSLVVQGAGQYMIMLHSHKAHGTNTYVEHVSDFTTGKACIRVPSADLTAGTWQVMVHSREAVNSKYRLDVSTWGVKGSIEPERHGHKREDGAFNVDKHAVEPCTEA